MGDWDNQALFHRLLINVNGYDLDLDLGQLHLEHFLGPPVHTTEQECRLILSRRGSAHRSPVTDLDTSAVSPFVSIGHKVRVYRGRIQSKRMYHLGAVCELSQLNESVETRGAYALKRTEVVAHPHRIQIVILHLDRDGQIADIPPWLHARVLGGRRPRTHYLGVVQGIELDPEGCQMSCASIDHIVLDIDCAHKSHVALSFQIEDAEIPLLFRS